jgi:tetratricopeptide (TPR) repeat protein
VSGYGASFVRHHLDLGAISAARAVAESGLQTARETNRNYDRALFHALMARIDQAEGCDPARHIDEVRTWTERSGDLHLIIEAHLLVARHLLSRGDPQGALSEAETGLIHASACAYRLLHIELLVTLARIQLAWPDPPKAIQAAREALDLSTHPDSQYAWGEADAAQVWGEAYFANHEPDLARRAFTQALAVRQRIEHPGVAETERWLGLVEA